MSLVSTNSKTSQSLDSRFWKRSNSCTIPIPRAPMTSWLPRSTSTLASTSWTLREFTTSDSSKSSSQCTPRCQTQSSKLLLAMIRFHISYAGWPIAETTSSENGSSPKKQDCSTTDWQVSSLKMSLRSWERSAIWTMPNSPRRIQCGLSLRIALLSMLSQDRKTFPRPKSLSRFHSRMLYP